MDVFNGVGFIGTAIYFLSYYLFNTGRFAEKPAQYIILNMTAALCVLVSLFEDFNAPSAAIQIGWVLLSICGLYRLRKPVAVKASEGNA